MVGPAAPETRKFGLLAIAALCGLLSAAIAVVTLLPAAGLSDLFDDLAATPFFLVAMIPVLTAAFIAGPQGCLVAALVSCIAAAPFIAPVSVGFLVLANAVPALAASFFGWRAQPLAVLPPGQVATEDAEGNWLAFLALYAVGIYLGFYGHYANAPGGLGNAIAQAMTDSADKAFASFKQFDQQNLPPDALATVRRAIPQFAPVIPAVIAASWMLMQVCAVTAAQWLAPRRLRLTQPVFIFNNIRVPGWVIFLTAGAGLLAVVLPQPLASIATNIAVISGLPYVFAGLAIVHARAARTPMPRLILTVFYVLISLMPYLGLLVALVGLLDEWFDFRRQRPPADPSDKP